MVQLTFIVLSSVNEFCANKNISFFSPIGTRLKLLKMVILFLLLTSRNIVSRWEMNILSRQTIFPKQLWRNLELAWVGGIFWFGLKTETFWFWTLLCEVWKGSLDINYVLDPNPVLISEEASSGAWTVFHYLTNRKAWETSHSDGKIY